MLSSSPIDSYLPSLPSEIWQFFPEAWPDGWWESRDFKALRMLSGPQPGYQFPPGPTCKLAKRRHRGTKDSSSKVSGHQRHENTVLLKYSADDDGIDSQLLEAGRLASLEQYAADKKLLDSTILNNGTATTSDAICPETSHTVHSRAVTPPLEHNAYGYITARSKGKGRAD
ncbi:hypothetical protein FS749_002170 [Ceratobasidium sp. UAMH 11750]|nr:hypothetical protein FS749_002170 [Ceratobasidium sp. UAMH 11750]